MVNIREYILEQYVLEAGRIIRHKLSKAVLRKHKKEYKKKKSQILRKERIYRKSPKFRKYKKLFKKRYARPSYHVHKRVYV